VLRRPIETTRLIGNWPATAAKIIFAFYSPCGILPSAMNLRWIKTFVVNSGSGPASLSQTTDILPFEVHYDG